MLNRNKILRGTYKKKLESPMHPALVEFAYVMIGIPVPNLIRPEFDKIYSEGGLYSRVPKVVHSFSRPAKITGYLGWNPSKTEN